MLEPHASGEELRHVLIVDSDPKFGRALEREFETLAFEVDIACTPDDAIRIVAAHPPDLVVLDLFLPDGATLELLRLWSTEAPAMPVILVSDTGSLPIVVAALQEGARRFRTKPVSAADLIADHHLSTTALTAEGVDRFFAISPGLLAIIGFDGYFKMINPAWVDVLGYSIDELCARPYLELVHPDDRAKASDEAVEIRGGQTLFRYRNRYRCKDGSYRWLSWSSTPSSGDGLIYASARDVTKIVRMEEGLREANERLKAIVARSERQLRECASKNTALVEVGQFRDEVVDMIIHDLKNPLSVIVANYDYILDGFEGAPDCVDALRDSQTAGRRMVRLLANLADVKQLERGALDVRVAETRLDQVLQPIVEQRRLLASSRQIAISLASSPEITALVDADLVTRTVENIFDNALRHVPAGGRIEVELAEVGAEVEIRIGNTGRAIPVEERNAVFGKHVSVGAGTLRTNLGLGLYFCRLAMEAQRGSIWIEETARLPAVFVIRLPRRLAIAATPTLAEPKRAISIPP